MLIILICLHWGIICLKFINVNNGPNTVSVWCAKGREQREQRRVVVNDQKYTHSVRARWTKKNGEKQWKPVEMKWRSNAAGNAYAFLILAYTNVNATAAVVIQSDPNVRTHARTHAYIRIRTHTHKWKKKYINTAGWTDYSCCRIDYTLYFCYSILWDVSCGVNAN